MFGHAFLLDFAQSRGHVFPLDALSACVTAQTNTWLLFDHGTLGCVATRILKGDVLNPTNYAPPKVR